MKNKKVLIILGVILILIFVGIMEKRNSENDTNTSENLSNKSKVEENTSNNAETSTGENTTLKEYYKDDGTINTFINYFNKLYPETQITSDMLSVYHHHGTEHKNQVKLYFDNLEITLTGESFSKTISISIDNGANNDNEKLKKLTIMFTKVLDNSLSDEKIEEYWNNSKSPETTSINDYNGIEYWTSPNKDIFSYIKITGKLM